MQRTIDTIPAVNVSGFTVATATGTGTLAVWYLDKNDALNLCSYTINATGQTLAALHTAAGSGTLSASGYSAAIIKPTVNSVLGYSGYTGVSSALNIQPIYYRLLGKNSNLQRLVTGKRVDTSFGTAVSNLTKTGYTFLHSVKVSSINTSTRYLHIFDKASAPSGGDVPFLVFEIPAGTATNPVVCVWGTDFFSSTGLACLLGLAWGISTTQATYTAATASDHNVLINYE